MVYGVSSILLCVMAQAARGLVDFGLVYSQFVLDPKL